MCRSRMMEALPVAPSQAVLLPLPVRRHSLRHANLRA